MAGPCRTCVIFFTRELDAQRCRRMVEWQPLQLPERGKSTMRRHLGFCRSLLLGLAFAILTACGTTGDDDADTAEATDAVSEVAQAGAAEPAAAFDEAEDVPTLAEDSADGDTLAMGEDAAEQATSQSGGDSQAVSTPSEANAGGEIGAAPLTATQQTAADLGRKIIFTADITVEVDDVPAAGQAATDAIANLGGFVFGQQTQGGAEPRSTLVFKVLPEDFEAAVEALGSVGELVSQSVSANDVTERVVDLQTRIEVAELGVDRLRQALTDSQDLEDYAELERLLLDRESELEVMRGSLRTVQDQIDLATITVTLVQDAVNHSMALQVTRYDTHDSGASCPGDFGSEGAVETETETTLCLEIINTGDEPLTELTVLDTALGVTDADDIITVFGDLTRLEAGQSVMVAHEFTADRTVRLRPKVTARPVTVGDDGQLEPAGPPIDIRADGFVDVFEPEGEPGFGEGLTAGLSVLSGLWTFLRVTTGFILPLLIPLFVLGAALVVARRRLDGALTRRRRSRERFDQPPPPPAQEPAASAASTAGAGEQADD